MKNTRAIFLSMIIIGVCGVIGMASGYLYKSRLPKPTAQRNIPAYTPQPTPAPSPLVYINDLPFVAFTKKWTDKYKGDFNFPEELRAMATGSDAIPFRCSEQYELKSQTTVTVGHENRSVLDQFTKDILTNVANTLTLEPRGYDLLTICQTQNGETYGLYSDGSGKNSPVFLQFDNDSMIIKQVTLIPVKNTYNVCSEILGVNSKFMYISCEGGDANSGHASIQRINHKTDQVKELIFCNFSGDYDSNQTNFDCKYY